jgi:arginyl-tRNA synthetase
MRQGARWTDETKRPTTRRMLLSTHLEELAAAAIEQAHGVKAPALLRPADPVHGDYQVNGVMALAKQRGENPRALAQPVADALAR